MPEKEKLYLLKYCPGDPYKQSCNMHDFFLTSSLYALKHVIAQEIRRNEADLMHFDSSLPVNEQVKRLRTARDIREINDLLENGQIFQYTLNTIIDEI